MGWIMENPGTFWIILGFVFLAIEVTAFGLGSGFLLFGSIGALLTGIAVWLQLIPAQWLFSVGAFGVISAVSAAVLWGPLKQLQSGTPMGQDRSSDLIGHEFLLQQQLTATEHGKTKFSGVDWRVEIDLEHEQAVDHVDIGRRVEVTRVNAGVFYVLPV